MKVSFGNAPSLVADVPSGARPVSDTPPVASVPAPYTPPANLPAKSSFDDDDEAFDPGDLVLPRLSIVQKVGDLSNVFTPGTIVLNGSLVLADAGKSFDPSKAIRIIVLGLQPTTFSEKLEGGARGRFFRSENEVVANNGTLDWNEHKATGKSLYQRNVLALVLVEQPGGIDENSFPHVIAGKRYALALYGMKGTSYTNAARHFKSAKKIGHLRTTGYRGGFWTFASQLKKFESNFAFIPVVKVSDATTEEFRNEIKSAVGF